MYVYAIRHRFCHGRDRIDRRKPGYDHAVQFGEHAPCLRVPPTAAPSRYRPYRSTVQLFRKQGISEANHLLDQPTPYS